MKTTRKLSFSSGTGFLVLTLATCISCSPVAEKHSASSERIISVTGNTPPPAASVVLPAAHPPTTKKKIKIALLLDTSNSMDGLINQAKSQLWKLVNELSGAKCGEEKPELEIALYEYGNSYLPSREGYIRQVALFTQDLDLISEKLFALSTNGGNEFCGYVINSSLDELNWQGDDDDLRIIFIAGNEPFTQGPVSANSSCKKAKEKDVIVNTIFCGSFEEGLETGWKNGALMANGEYMSIEQDRQTVYIESPYDREIAELSSRINNTYISYGVKGFSKKANQLAQDKNAQSYGLSNSTERAISKTSSFYSNAEWDIVDASKNKGFDIQKLKDSDLPEELKGKSVAEKEHYIATKKAERESITAKITELNKQRIKYVAEKEKLSGNSQSLDAAMLKAIRQQASKKKFSFDS